VSHHNIRLPDFFIGFIYSSFSFESIISTSYSGREFIKNGREAPFHHYKIVSARINNQQFEEFYSFYNGMRGPLHSFRLKDMNDYRARDEILVADEDSISKFKLFKTYNDRGFIFHRNIDLPILDTISIIKNGEVEDFIFEEGEVMLKRSLEPREDLVINFEFDVKVRFVTNKIEYSYCEDGSILLNDIIMKEICDV